MKGNQVNFNLQIWFSQESAQQQVNKHKNSDCGLQEWK